MKYFNTYLELHLGDNIRHLDYLRKIIDNNPEYSFIHYAREIYLNELHTQIIGYEDNIQLKTIETGIPEDAINVWINTDNWYEKYYCPKIFQTGKSPLMYDKMYIEWFNLLEQKYNLPNPIKTSEDFKSKFIGLDVYDIEKEYDVLIINSTPQSGQYYYEEGLFKKLCYHLINQDYDIITTKKIDNIECTLDYNYNLTQIAKISTKTPIIIAVDTGPIHLCLNEITLNNSKMFHVLHKSNSYSFKEITWSPTLQSIQF
jgi:hypothetical protein